MCLQVSLALKTRPHLVAFFVQQPLLASTPAALRTACSATRIAGSCHGLHGYLSDIDAESLQSPGALKGVASATYHILLRSLRFAKYFDLTFMSPVLEVARRATGS